MNPNAFLAWLVAELLADGPVSGLVGTRIYPDQAPEATPNPCIVYQLFGGEFEDTIETGPTPSGDLLVQVRCYASTRAAANSLRNHVRNLVQGRVNETLNDGSRLDCVTAGGYQDTFEDETGDFGALLMLRAYIRE